MSGAWGWRLAAVALVLVAQANGADEQALPEPLSLADALALARTDLPQIELALDAGINFIDTAPDYSAAGSEAAVGRAIDAATA